MFCVMCDKALKNAQAEHIAIDENGEPVVMCDECYSKARAFFEEVKTNGKANS